MRRSARHMNSHVKRLRRCDFDMRQADSQNKAWYRGQGYNTEDSQLAKFNSIHNLQVTVAAATGWAIESY